MIASSICGVSAQALLDSHLGFGYAALYRPVVIDILYQIALLFIFLLIQHLAFVTSLANNVL